MENDKKDNPQEGQNNLFDEKNNPNRVNEIFDELSEMTGVNEQPEEPEQTNYKTPNLVAGINQVMREVKNIEKNSTVGEGRFAFNAVSDKDVKYQIGQAMERAGLAIIPVGVEPIATVERWEEQFNGKPKRKKEVFTEVRTKYRLMHESGQSIELAGYGHGVDTQDKSAGKATTYALKYALLYLFMVPTGKIDDGDKTQPEKDERKKQTLTDQQFQNGLKAIDAGKYTAEQLENDYALTPEQLKQLKK